jgi:hypothetical protein
MRVDLSRREIQTVPELVNSGRVGRESQVDPSPIQRLGYAALIELVFLSATWLAGIYVNGFVAIIPGTSLEVVLLNPAIDLHIVLASLSALTSVFILALAWSSGSRSTILLTLFASVSIIVAGYSGLSFVLGGGTDSGQSMVMAIGFVTALFLTFLSVASLRVDRLPSLLRGSARDRLKSGVPATLCCLALLLFYSVFISGIYVNLYVAGPVFSLPLNSELAAFTRAEQTAPFIIHEALGVILIGALVMVVVSLWSGGARKLSISGIVLLLLVAYSAYVGSLNITSPPVPDLSGGADSVLVPMVSAACFMAAIVVTMLLTLRLRSDSSSR